jgi:hypothetical protein
MATNFPTSLDSLTNPTSSDSLNSPSHSAQHANVNDAVEALQVKVGVDSSAVTSSHDYKIADHASRIATLEGRNTAGLVHISRTTIGTAVSSLTLSGIFSADYDNYRILISGGSGSSNQFIQFSFPGAATAAYNTQIVYGAWSTGTASASGSSGADPYFPYMGTVTPTSLQGCVDIQSPYLTEQTFLGSFYARPGHIGAWCSSVLNDSSSYTGITVAPASGTFSDGNIDVYGYAKA